ETVAVAIQPLQICQGSGISFSRRSSSATTADRQWPVIIFRQDLFQPEVYPPVGGEVIFIAERFPPVEPETGQQHPPRIVIKAEAAQISNPVILAGDPEAMQVLVAPIEASLNVFMELGDAGIAGQEQTPPNQRTDP